MILLVPISPEVPKYHRPKLWPSLLMVLAVAIAFFEVYPVLQKDTQYVESIESLLEEKTYTQDELQKKADNYLRLRPLLKIAPSRGDWDIKRLIYANFIHGTPMHLLLNLVGVFAGVRICTTFIPFL